MMKNQIKHGVYLIIIKAKRFPFSEKAHLGLLN